MYDSAYRQDMGSHPLYGKEVLENDEVLGVTMNESAEQ
jgi:hypothetical protein